MHWQEALEIVVASTKHERYRALCDDAHPDHESYRAMMISKAIGEAPRYPSMVAMAGNLMGAIGRTVATAAAGENPLVNQAERDRRFQVCAGCEFFDHSQSRCTKCGCVAPLKAMLAGEQCPEGKW